MPEYTRIRCDSVDLTTTSPVELRADSVVVCERDPRPDEQEPVATLAIIVECQNGYDGRKRFSWPAYTANLHARLRCPVILLVLTPDTRLARWCSQPIDLGGGHLVQRPLALALTDLEPIADPVAAAAEPTLAILTAAASRTQDHRVLDALLAAFHALDRSKTGLYSDYVLAALPAAARKYLEDAVNASTYEFKTEFIGNIHREGVAKGEASAVLLFLDARGIEVSDSDRERITSCADIEQLDIWIRRAATITSSEELFT